MKALIDGDILVYRCGFAAQTGRGEDVVAEPVENALSNVKNVVAGIVKAMETEDICVHLSGGENFRYDIATERPYKGNRVDAPKPVHYADILRYIKRMYPVCVSTNQEADDDLGINQTLLTNEYTDPDQSVICSIDKDLDMIPGNHYNFVKNAAYYISPEDAWRFFYTQLITGDVTDNIPGIPGKGPAAAREALADVKTECDAYQKVRTLYVEHFSEKNADEALLEQARLLWIRRHEDELWSPPDV